MRWENTEGARERKKNQRENQRDIQRGRTETDKRGVVQAMVTEKD